MKKTLRDVIKLALPPSKEKREALALAKEYLEPEVYKAIASYLRMDKCFANIEQFATPLGGDLKWPVFKSHLRLKEVDEMLGEANARIIQLAHQRAYEVFAPQALKEIEERIAPNIVGLEVCKRAAALQLFASDPVHILLIGDPGTGKTDVLRSVQEISPIASFGLGSGVSGVGLSAAAKGDEIIKGLLPLADGGIACIDELNLVKAKDLAALYNAMEKGFVSYDKGSKHEQLPARVRVCATANPTNDVFVGHSAEILKKQMPFGNALLSRFHLVCVVRSPTEEQFGQIAHSIVKGKREHLSAGDAAFLKGYVRAAEQIAVTVPPELELQIVEFVRQLKKDERKLLVEVGPRTVVGIVRLVRAGARASMQEVAREEHVHLAVDLVKEALYARGSHDEKS